MMDKVRPPYIVSEQIRDLNKIIASAKTMLERYPDDYALQLTVAQDEQMKGRLMAELEESLSAYRQHSVRYIFKAASEAVNLDVFLESLSSFKDLVDKTFDVVCKSVVPLKFETVFSGSFGILLSTPFDEDLIAGNYEQGFDSVFNTLQMVSSNNVDVHKLVNENLKGNRKLVRKYVNFLDSVVSSQNPVELSWKDHYKDGVKVTISVDSARRLSGIFKEHEKVKPEIVEYKGYVKGISLLNNRVEFQCEAEKKKKVIKARFDKMMTKEVKDAFDLLAIARFKLDVELNEITEEEIRKWELVKIAPV